MLGNIVSSSLDLGTYWDKFSFCKRKRIWLCFTDGNIWPSKISNGPQKMMKGAERISDLGTTLTAVLTGNFRLEICKNDARA